MITWSLVFHCLWSKARANSLRANTQLFPLLIKHLKWAWWLSLASMNRHNYNYVYSVVAVDMLPSCYVQQSTTSLNLRFKSIESARTIRVFLVSRDQTSIQNTISLSKFIRELDAAELTKFLVQLHNRNVLVQHSIHIESQLIPHVAWHHFLFYILQLDCNWIINL